MFSLNELKNTGYFQQVAEESRQENQLESVPGLLQLGLTVEQFASALQLDVVEVIKISNQLSNNCEN